MRANLRGLEQQAEYHAAQYRLRCAEQERARLALEEKWRRLRKPAGLSGFEVAFFALLGVALGAYLAFVIN